jgi:hypothetical protein
MAGKSQDPVLRVLKQDGEYVLTLNGREIESAMVDKRKDGGFDIALRLVELYDEQYLTLPKEFEVMQLDLLKLLKNMDAVNALYECLTTMDLMRPKHFADYDVIPYYATKLVIKILLKYAACRMHNGALRKTERFTQFLLHRAETSGSTVFGKGVVKNVDTILMEEEKAERKYRLPASNELKEMNYEMLTLEMAKAEEMMAKPKFIKILKEMRLAKAPAKNRKTELQRMKDVIQEEKIDQEEQAPQTRLAKHQLRKAEKQRQEKIRYEQPAKTQPKIKIAKAEDAEYVE